MSQILDLHLSAKAAACVGDADEKSWENERRSSKLFRGRVSSALAAIISPPLSLSSASWLSLARNDMRHVTEDGAISAWSHVSTQDLVTIEWRLEKHAS